MKKRRGCFAHCTNKEDVGNESSRKGQGQSHVKKMKAQPQAEHNESSSEFSVDDDVVDAMMLLSVQPDEVCSPDSELMPDHFRIEENILPIVYIRKRFRKNKNDGCLMSFFDRLRIRDADKEAALTKCRNDPPTKLMWSIDTEGLLKLNPNLIPFQEFSTQLSLPVCPLLGYPFGSSTTRVQEQKISRILYLLALQNLEREMVRQAPTCTVKHEMLSFVLSYSAAPLFFRSLHLKLLMRSSLACVRLMECTLACSVELRGKTCNSTTICCALPKHFCEIFQQVHPESTSETSLTGKHHSVYHLEIHPETASLNCYGTIPSHHKSFDAINTRNSSTLPLEEICSIWKGERTNDVHVGFDNVPWKPQTFIFLVSAY
ncbi:hypothetical protein AgCh_025930 [Apium graveolens]